jgi:hypothetical protein
MAKAKKETAVVDETAAVIQEEVVTTEVVATEEVSTVTGFAAQEVGEVLEVELIAPDTFISEEGKEYEFTTGAFVFKGKKYDVADAVANAPEVLEELLKLNSFILKQK